MPIYVYMCVHPSESCERCQEGFETIQSIHDQPLARCPDCGAPVEKQIAPCRIGRSETSLDNRAKAAGFTKLKRLGKGEYEKEY